LTGDLFLDQRWVPLFAGQPRLDIDRWLAVLERTLDGPNPIDRVIPGHMDLWDAEKLDLWRDYIAYLWEGVKDAKDKGLTLEQAKPALPLPERCLYLKERGHDDERIRRFHEENIEAFWRQLFVSAAQAIEEVLQGSGFERVPASEKLFEKMRKEPEVYRIDESEFNSLGYRLLERNDIWAALIVFQFNVESYPQSYNAYDSLAEAYMNMGDKYYAETYYRKSLELNPDNQNARDRLERMDEFFAEHHTPDLKDALFAPGEQTGLEGFYLGQTPPKLKAEKFAPGIVSTEGGFEFSCTFSPDGREFYFNRGMTILVSRWEEKGWTAPEPASFNGDFRNHEPHITADGRTLYFGSMRPNPDRPAMRRPYGIWKVERSKEGWGPARYAGYGMYVSTTAGGAVYVTDVDSADSMQHGIVRTEIIDGRFGPLVRQTGGVAHPEPGRRAGRHPCIAPDESFIIFDSYTLEHPGGDGHLFICFREEDRSWGRAVDLSKIFGTEGGIAASLSPDGRCLFFATGADIYWIGTDFIERLRKDTKYHAQ
jgi:tetratricopeptide (TPR) repeat protein